MSGPKRNPDKLNTIGVVVVGICGAVLVYVSIVALQAFYMNDTSEVQTMADYGGQETTAISLRATQTGNIEECVPNQKPEAGKTQTYRIPIKYAIKLVADEAKVDPGNLVPAVGRSDKATILPIYGRPKAIKAPEPAPSTPPTVPPGQEPTSPAMTPTGNPPPGAGSAAPTSSPPPSTGGNPPTPNPQPGTGSNPKTGETPKTGSAASTPKTGSAASTTGISPKTGSAAPKPKTGSAAPKTGSGK
ncbi:MAG TPA: hypothetical protein VL856_11785 [Acidimicrobiia bacterium]|nr:hypothetical protein [Acidimicrobiia bacterium]